MGLRIRARAKCYPRTTQKFQLNLNTTLWHKHVNHFLISTVSSLSNGADLFEAKVQFLWPVINSTY